MASQGRGRRGGGRSNNPLPSTFDQLAFMEAIGATIATIAQASVAAATIAQAILTAGQGGLSNLQRFKAHHPSAFRGGGDPMIADHLFWKMEKIYRNHLRCHQDKVSHVSIRG